MPPDYLAENEGPVPSAALQWEPQKALDAVDAQNVATAASRSRCLESGSETRRLLAARSRWLMNTPLTSLETIADVLVSFPPVSLSDTEGTLREIEYALA